MSNWQERGACSGTDPEAFFPEYNRDVENQKEQILDALNALRVCSACTVSAECFAYAMQSDDSINAGIYAGTLAFERQRIAKKKGRIIISGGAPRLEQAIRRHADKQRIAVPPLGVEPLNESQRRQSQRLA
jgi:WhiB family redox-sensing transcriptional regulator